MSEQICPCSAACDPKNYEGRLMLWPDEAWHNWKMNPTIYSAFKYLDMRGEET